MPKSPRIEPETRDPDGTHPRGDGTQLIGRAPGVRNPGTVDGQPARVGRPASGHDGRPIGDEPRDPRDPGYDDDMATDPPRGDGYGDQDSPAGDPEDPPTDDDDVGRYTSGSASGFGESFERVVEMMIDGGDRFRRFIRSRRR